MPPSLSRDEKHPRDIQHINVLKVFVKQKTLPIDRRVSHYEQSRRKLRDRNRASLLRLEYIFRSAVD